MNTQITDIEWINDYTALITTPDELDKGDRLTLQPTDRHDTTNTLAAKITDIDKDSNRYIAEVKGPLQN